MAAIAARSTHSSVARLPSRQTDGRWAYKYPKPAPRWVSYFDGTHHQTAARPDSTSSQKVAQNLWPVIFFGSTRRRFKRGTLALAVRSSSRFRSWRLPTPTPVTNLGERPLEETLRLSLRVPTEEVSGLGRSHRLLVAPADAEDATDAVPAATVRWRSRQEWQGWHRHKLITVISVQAE